MSTQYFTGLTDFPLLEWDDETQRFYAMHHPFTAPKPEHEKWFYSNRKEDLERVCALFGGSDSIRDYIAFPKNNQGRDVMIDSPSEIDQIQLDELQIKVDLKES